jgi:hypothetical protein
VVSSETMRALDSLRSVKSIVGCQYLALIGSAHAGGVLSQRCRYWRPGLSRGHRCRRGRTEPLQTFWLRAQRTRFVVSRLPTTMRCWTAVAAWEGLPCRQSFVTHKTKTGVRSQRDLHLPLIEEVQRNRDRFGTSEVELVVGDVAVWSLSSRNGLQLHARCERGA